MSVHTGENAILKLVFLARTYIATVYEIHTTNFLYFILCPRVYAFKPSYILVMRQNFKNTHIYFVSFIYENSFEINLPIYLTLSYFML